MKSKLNFLVDNSFKRKVKSKWFIAANIILAVVLISLANIDTIIKSFGGDFNEKQIIYVVDNTSKTYDIFKKNIDNYESLTGSNENSYKIKKATKSPKELLKDDNEEAWYLIFDNSDDNVIKVKMVSSGFIDTLDYQEINTIINNTKTEIAMNETSIDQKELAKLTSAVSIEREILDESKKTEDEATNMIVTVVFPTIILPFFILSILLVQMIGAEVNDEKTTRGMEIIISNVSPTTHFFSKVIAGNLFIIMQGILISLYALIGLGVRNLLGTGGITKLIGSTIGDTVKDFIGSDIMGQLITMIPLVLLMMIITFLAYSLVAGILASMTTNTEDFQQLQTPIIIVSLIGYYLAMMAGMFKGALFIKIFAFVPFVSAILAPSLLFLGQISIIEFIISILLVVVLIYFLIKYGLRIYKVGILNYSSKGLWKKMFKAMKTK